jgi:hypothetical protein
VRPYVPQERRIGISNVDKIIDDNYALWSKWTIIRDLNGICLEKYLKYHSTVIDMDTFDFTQSQKILEIMRDISSTICTIYLLISSISKNV